MITNRAGALLSGIGPVLRGRCLHRPPLTVEALAEVRVLLMQRNRPRALLRVVAFLGALVLAAPASVGGAVADGNQAEPKRYTVTWDAVRTAHADLSDLPYPGDTG